MLKIKTNLELDKKIAKLSEWDLIPDIIAPPTKKLKTTKAASKETVSKIEPTVTTNTNLLFRFAKSKKTSILGASPLRQLLSPKSGHAFQKELRKNKSYTPIKEMIEISKTGTPKKVKTEHDHVLYLHSRNGIFYNYSEEKPKPEKLFIASHSVSTKKVSVTIDETLLKLVAKKILMNKGRRCKTQNAVMGGSATQYTHDAGISLKNKSEWGHLIAHRFLSDLAQHRDNLAAITDYANSEMIPVEDFVARIAMNQSGKIKIVVTAHLIGDKEIASLIHYNVHIGGHIIPFTFNAQQGNKPDIANKEAMKAFCSVLLSHKKLESKVNKRPLALSKTLPFLFSKSGNVKKIKLEVASIPFTVKKGYK